MHRTQFEFTRPEAEETTYAEAERLRYDLVAGTVEFSGNADITEGGNQISPRATCCTTSPSSASAPNPSGPGDDRVKITVIPEVIEEEFGDREDLDTDAALEEAEQRLQSGSEA